MSGYYQHADAGEGTGDDLESGAKRKRDDGGGIQHRTKRNRYISIACNECKRRKIKCNGQTPCQRCGNLNLDCIYSPNCCSNNFRDSQEFKQLTGQVNALQDQITHIFHNLTSLRSSLGQDEYHFGRDESIQFRDDSLQQIGPLQSSLPIDPALQNRAMQQQHQRSQRFQDDNSSPLALDITQSNLRNADIASAEDAIHHGILSQTDGLTHAPMGSMPESANVSSKDPIWLLSKDEALRLCEVFEAEIGVMYPVLDTARLKRHAMMLFKFIDAVSRTFMRADKPGQDSIHDQDTDLLKLVLAVTLVVENSGHSDLGKKLFDFVNKDTNSRLLGNFNVKDLQILTLTALYHLYHDDNSLARRITGLTARLCLELGLHRSDSYGTMFPTDLERASATHLFWSIYILDHTWSLGAEMSVAIPEADVDPKLRRPSDSSPYLDAMIDYARLCDEVRRFVAVHDTTYGGGESGRAIDEFAHKISQWQNRVPESLRCNHTNINELLEYDVNTQINSNEIYGRGFRRLRVLLYLRANHMRTCIFRTIISSRGDTVQLQQASSNWVSQAVETSKDTIRVLSRLSAETDLYHTQKPTFDPFLLEALATIFLANSFAPVQFEDASIEEFHNGLLLVQRFSASSNASKRLAKAVRGLKELMPKVGFFVDYRQHFENNIADSGSISESVQQNANLDQKEAQRSAAMAMAGLAGHTVQDNGGFVSDAQSPATQSIRSNDATNNNSHMSELTAMSPNDMANDLASLFEALGQIPRKYSSYSSGAMSMQQIRDHPEGIDMRSNASELNQILKGLF